MVGRPDACGDGDCFPHEVGERAADRTNVAGAVIGVGVCKTFDKARHGNGPFAYGAHQWVLNQSAGRIKSKVELIETVKAFI